MKYVAVFQQRWSTWVSEMALDSEYAVSSYAEYIEAKFVAIIAIGPPPAMRGAR